VDEVDEADRVDEAGVEDDGEADVMVISVVSVSTAEDTAEEDDAEDAAEDAAEETSVMTADEDAMVEAAADTEIKLPPLLNNVTVAG
jgi:hypothetical protein